MAVNYTNSRPLTPTRSLCNQPGVPRTTNTQVKIEHEENPENPGFHARLKNALEKAQFQPSPQDYVLRAMADCLLDESGNLEMTALPDVVYFIKNTGIFSTLHGPLLVNRLGELGDLWKIFNSIGIGADGQKKIHPDAEHLVRLTIHSHDKSDEISLYDVRFTLLVVLLSALRQGPVGICWLMWRQIPVQMTHTMQMVWDAKFMVEEGIIPFRRKIVDEAIGQEMIGQEDEKAPLNMHFSTTKTYIGGESYAGKINPEKDILYFREDVLYAYSHFQPQQFVIINHILDAIGFSDDAQDRDDLLQESIGTLPIKKEDEGSACIYYGTFFDVVDRFLLLHAGIEPGNFAILIKLSVLEKNLEQDEYWSQSDNDIDKTKKMVAARGELLKKYRQIVKKLDQYEIVKKIESQKKLAREIYAACYANPFLKCWGLTHSSIFTKNNVNACFHKLSILLRKSVPEEFESGIAAFLEETYRYFQQRAHFMVDATMGKMGYLRLYIRTKEVGERGTPVKNGKIFGSLMARLIREVTNKIGINTKIEKFSEIGKFLASFCESKEFVEQVEMCFLSNVITDPNVKLWLAVIGGDIFDICVDDTIHRRIIGADLDSMRKKYLRVEKPEDFLAELINQERESPVFGALIQPLDVPRGKMAQRRHAFNILSDHASLVTAVKADAVPENWIKAELIEPGKNELIKPRDASMLRSLLMDIASLLPEKARCVFNMPSYDASYRLIDVLPFIREALKALDDKMEKKRTRDLVSNYLNACFPMKNVIFADTNHGSDNNLILLATRFDVWSGRLQFVELYEMCNPVNPGAPIIKNVRVARSWNGWGLWTLLY